MADNSSEVPQNSENPQEPPLKGMFDRWQKDGTNSPRDIASEEHDRARQGDIENFGLKSEAEIQKDLSIQFLNIFQKNRDFGRSGLGYYNKDMTITFWGDGGYLDDVPTDWNPEQLFVDVQSFGGRFDENERIYSRWFRGMKVPEFFKMGKNLFMVLAQYEFNLKDNAIIRDNEIVRLVGSLYGPDDRFNRNMLEDMSNTAVSRLNLSEDEVQELANSSGTNIIVDSTDELQPEDYELLKSLLVAIETGEVSKIQNTDVEEK